MTIWKDQYTLGHVPSRIWLVLRMTHSVCTYSPFWNCRPKAPSGAEGLHDCCNCANKTVTIHKGPDARNPAQEGLSLQMSRIRNNNVNQKTMAIRLISLDTAAHQA